MSIFGNFINCLEIDIGLGKMTNNFHLCTIEKPIFEFDFLKNNNINLDATTCILSCTDFPDQINDIEVSISSFDSLPAYKSKYT